MKILQNLIFSGSRNYRISYGKFRNYEVQTELEHTARLLSIEHLIYFQQFSIVLTYVYNCKWSDILKIGNTTIL